MRRNCRYLSQDCPMTLREGIEELRKAEGAAEDASTKVSAELSRDLGIHDAIHVLFGCRTDLAGEVVAHVWTVFGTTARIRDLHRVGGHPDHRAIIAEIGHLRLLRAWLGSLPRVAATIKDSLRMTKRWPVEDFPAFLERPLVELRQEFRIRLRT